MAYDWCSVTQPLMYNKTSKFKWLHIICITNAVVWNFSSSSSQVMPGSRVLPSSQVLEICPVLKLCQIHKLMPGCQIIPGSQIMPSAQSMLILSIMLIFLLRDSNNWNILLIVYTLFPHIYLVLSSIYLILKFKISH